uniref:Anthocyanin acyltransferase n=1 Tax=Torenia hybrid cultivar TaxID=75807 RepID=A9EEB3_9LAMI|nr:anthocyanin acyltransferase [Torenia hybrid cultivar]
MAVEAPKTICAVLENSLITPQSTDTEQTLSLTFFDIKWVHFHPMQCLVLYNFPCSKSHFLEATVPSFKSSLSKTLRHYLPLSGNLYYPNPTHDMDDDESNMPEIRYKPGDSVSLTVAEYFSGHEDNTTTEEYFNYLTGNFQRDCDQFYDLLPDFRDPETESNCTVIPLIAVQITLFPGAGICLGVINSHVVGDASSIVGFIKAWSKVAMYEDDEEILANNNLIPSYDRSVVKDPKGIKSLLWNKMKNVKYQPQPAKHLPTNKVRATYTLRKNDIERLKTRIRSKKPGTTCLSSFTIATAYAWTCLAKSAAEAEEQVVQDSDDEHLLMPVDLRPRIDPPLPPSYFGNCVLPSFAKTTHGLLKGELGLFNAVEVISDVITGIVSKKYDLFKDLDRQGEIFRALFGKRVLAIMGSPKFDLYEVDFGWGKPKKIEPVSIDRERTTMWISKSGEFEGGLEIGFSFNKKKMDAFGECFNSGLKDI